MSTEPYDQDIDRRFDQITRPYRHPGGHTMRQERTARDQMHLMLGCGGFTLLTALAAAVVLVAWSFL